MLDHRLRIGTEMVQIGKAHTIDAGRVAPGPTSPDQPRDVEQDGRVVSHQRRQRAMFRTVEMGRIDEARMLTKRCRSAAAELAT